MNFGEYALIAADTRVVCRYEDGVVENDDNADKIWKIRLGLIAGAGFAPLVESAEHLLADREIANVEELVQILGEERARILREPLANDPDVRQGIEYTEWMFSYLAAQNADKPQLAMTASFLPNSWGAVALNRACLLTPAGTTPEQLEEWLAFANDNLRPLERPEDLQANVGHHRQVVGRLMKMVADVNNSVAETFRVGVHAPPNRTGISEVLRYAPH